VTAPTAPVTVEAEVLSALRVLYRRAAVEWAEDDPALRLAAAALARADGRPAPRRRQLANVSTTLTLELDDVEIEGWATKAPARITIDPETSHPDESEAEVVKATWQGHDITGLVSGEFFDEAEDALLEALDEYEPDYEEADL
jgi:hypothetical protein